MKKTISALVLVVALACAGCGGTAAVKGATNPQVRADLTQAEGIVKSCLTKSKTLKGFTACAAPKGHEAALEACAVKAFIHFSKLESDLANCVVKNR